MHSKVILICINIHNEKGLKTFRETITWTATGTLEGLNVCRLDFTPTPTPGGVNNDHSLQNPAEPSDFLI